MAAKLILSQHDVHQPVWQAIKTYCEERLAKHRAVLENPRTAPEMREGLICRIDELKKLLAIGDPEQNNGAGAGE